MRRAVLLSVFAVLAKSIIIANTGGVTSVFDIGFGARAQSLAGAVSSVYDDSAAVYANPAAAYSVQKTEIQAGYTPLFMDTTYNFAVAAFPTESFGTFFGSAALFGTPGIIFRDDKGQQNGGASQTLFEGSAGWAGNIKMLNIDTGLSVKFDTHSIGGYFDSGYGFDFGMIYTPFYGENTLRTALSVKNIIEPFMNLKTNKDINPRQIITGLSFKRKISEGFSVMALSDVSFFKGGYGIKAGFETEIFGGYFLRAGYDTSGIASFGAGAMFMDFINADYGFFMGDAGLNHRVSLRMRFGESVSKIREDKEAAELARINKRIAEEMQKKEKELEKKYAGKGEEALKREKYKARNYIAGVEYFRDGKIKEAKASFMLVKEVDPNYMNVITYLSELAAYDKYSEENYSEEELKLYRQGVEYYMNEKYEEAKASWEAAIRINKYNVPAREGLRKLELLLKKIEAGK